LPAGISAKRAPRVPSGEHGGGEFGSGGSTKIAKIAKIGRGKLAKKSGGNEGGDRSAESEITAHIARGKSASEKKYGASDIYERHIAEKEALKGLIPKYDKKTNPEKFLGQGAEHYVEHDLDHSLVRKFTTDGYGFTLQGHAAPFGHYAELREATPRSCESGPYENVTARPTPLL
jgi:hypothetical protein